MHSDDRTIVTELRLSRDGRWRPGDTGQDPRWTLTVEDRASGMTFLEFTLTDAQFAGLLTASGAQDVNASILPVPNLKNVGLLRWHVGVVFSHYWDGDSSGNPEQRLRNLVESAALDRECGATVSTVRKVRDGIALQFIGYAATSVEAVRAARECADNLATTIDANGWNIGDRETPRPYPTQADVDRADEKGNRYVL